MAAVYHVQCYSSMHGGWAEREEWEGKERTCLLREGALAVRSCYSREWSLWVVWLQVKEEGVYGEERVSKQVGILTWRNSEGREREKKVQVGTVR